MLRLTARAYAIARMLVVEHGARGLRVCDGASMQDDVPQLLIGPAGGPAADDRVIVVGDLEVYLDAVAEHVLDERVLDAAPEAAGLRWEASPSVDDPATAPSIIGAEAAAADVERLVERLVTCWSGDLDLLVAFDAYYHGRHGEPG